MIHYENMYCNQNIYLIYLPQYHSNILFLGSRVSGIKPVQLAPMIANGGYTMVQHTARHANLCCKLQLTSLQLWKVWMQVASFGCRDLHV